MLNSLPLEETVVILIDNFRDHIPGYWAASLHEIALTVMQNNLPGA